MADSPAAAGGGRRGLRTASRGYAQGEVIALLDEVRAVSAAGGSVIPLIREARFRRELNGFRPDDVHAVLQNVVAMEGAGAGLPSGSWAYMATKEEARQRQARRAEEAEAVWAAFADLPGTHLRVQKVKRSTYDMVRPDGLRWGQLRQGWKVRAIVTVGPKTFRIGGIRTVQVKNQSTGTVLMSARGRHINRRADGQVVLGPVPEFAPDTVLTFPVEGKKHHATMRVLDPSRSVVMQVRKAGRGTAHEVVVPAERHVNDELLCLVALCFRWIDTYFDSQGGGG
jgi:hypothetical protein